MKVKALITAAGMSSRMKSFKPLMKIGDKYMAERVIDNLREAGAEEIVMVTGNRADELEAVLAHTGVRFVRNPDYSTTQMFESVKIGLKALIGGSGNGEEGVSSFGRILFTPVDVPMTSPDTIRNVIRTDARIVMPQYQGRLGHPIAIDEELVDSILSFEGDYGLRGALESTGERIARLDTDDQGLILDADTPEEFDRVVKLDSIRKRIILVRHATPAGYDGAKKYIGRTDLPLGDQGAKEAVELARWINGNMRVDRLFASPLERAKRTGEIIADTCNNETGVTIDSRLQEIDAGAWEGLDMQEVREKFPEEYESRGEDIYNWKFPGGESFRDVYYRIKKFINDIVIEEPDKRETIVVVSHTGVIGSYLAGTGSIEESEVRRIPIPCASMTTLTCDRDGVIEIAGTGVRPVELLTDEEIDRLYVKYGVLDNVIAHMRAVAEYQDELLDELEAAGRYYDREILRKAALLHDIARIEKRHAEAGELFIRKEGYAAVAELVSEHHSPERKKCVADGDGRGEVDITLGDILFYADKRVKETSVVSLEERFALDARKHTNEKLIDKRDAQLNRARRIERALKEVLI